MKSAAKQLGGRSSKPTAPFPLFYGMKPPQSNSLIEWKGWNGEEREKERKDLAEEVGQSFMGGDGEEHP